MPPVHFGPRPVEGVENCLPAKVLAVVLIWRLFGNPPGALHDNRWLGLTVVRT